MSRFRIVARIGSRRVPWVSTFPAEAVVGLARMIARGEVGNAYEVRDLVTGSLFIMRRKRKAEEVA